MSRFCPLFSGSAGNSYYIGSKKAGILVDAGRSAKQLDLMLCHCGIDPFALQGILITHEHSDHVRGLRVFAKRHSLPVFASEGTLSAIKDLEEVETHVIEDELQIADMTIRNFKTSHDCAEPLGFRIDTADQRVVTISTDLGFISDEIRYQLEQSDLVVLESNHDVEMLRNGPYPYYLKRRILSDRGHLSNNACASILPSLAAAGATRFFLAHLSKENNARQLAIDTSLRKLESQGFNSGVDFVLDALKAENNAGDVVVF